LILERRPDLLPDRLKSQVIVRLDQREPSANQRVFVMLSPAENDRVVGWLFENSARPKTAVRLWLKLFMHLDWNTGEVALTREELAELVDILPQHVSAIMSELESIGAISKRREKVAGMRGPGVTRYFMSPLVATHLAGAARDKAQASAPPLLALIDGGKP